MSYSYLGSPYSSPDPTVMDQRYQTAAAAFVWLMNRKIWAFSPVVHCHEVAKVHELPRSFAFWAEYNRSMLKGASTLIVLATEGWERSVGLGQELTWARRWKMPVRYLRPSGGSDGAFIMSKELV